MAQICKSVLGLSLRDLEVSNQSSEYARIRTDHVHCQIQALAASFSHHPTIDLHIDAGVREGLKKSPSPLSGSVSVIIVQHVYKPARHPAQHVEF